MTRPIRVLVVDDSALIREMLAKMLSAFDDIEVVGKAVDPTQARRMIKELSPDVLTLDVEMPNMDGVTFLSHLMRLRPMPVVMVSSLTTTGADVTLQALELGAVDFVAKPAIDVAHTFHDYADEIAGKIRVAARARIRPRTSAPPAASRSCTPRVLGIRTTHQLLAIGASTGGTEAIREVLQAMPAAIPGTVIVQHIPPRFSTSFAERLNSLCAVTVCEARDKQEIQPGHAYIAPGDRHLRVERSGARFLCRLDDGDCVSQHKPSVDVLFNSLAESVGRNAVAALLTGMGKDGAEGMLAMRKAGARTFAQDEASSVVWGMPRAAVKIDAAEAVLPLDGIATAMLDAAAR